MRLNKLLALTLSAAMITGSAQIRYLPEEYNAQMLTADAATIGSGKCGENLAWLLDNEGVLTISGTGAMDNYETASSVPWYGSRTKITSVIINKGATNIGDFAFRNCSLLTSVTLPETVTSIGKEAFAYCSKLTELSLPSGVTSIGSGAFVNCVAITDMTVPDGVTEIPAETFKSCIGLTTLNLPKTLESIGEKAMYACEKLKTMTIPSTVTSIGNDAFKSTAWLTEKQKVSPFVVVNGMLIDGKNCEGDITLPDSVKSVEANAFSDNSRITSVVIPDSVTAVKEKAFNSCMKLETVVVGKDVEKVDSEAFAYCSNLKEITFENPKCEIFDDSVTVFNTSENGEYNFSGIIYGYTGSTADAYAKKYERLFISLGGDDIEETTTTSTTTTTTSIPRTNTTTTTTTTTAPRTTTTSTTSTWIENTTTKSPATTTKSTAKTTTTTAKTTAKTTTKSTAKTTAKTTTTKVTTTTTTGAYSGSARLRLCTETADNYGTKTLTNSAVVDESGNAYLDLKYECDNNYYYGGAYHNISAMSFTLKCQNGLFLPSVDNTDSRFNVAYNPMTGEVEIHSKGGSPVGLGNIKRNSSDYYDYNDASFMRLNLQTDPSADFTAYSVSIEDLKVYYDEDTEITEAFSISSGTVKNAQFADSDVGSCGDNLTWAVTKVDGDLTLEIKGTGEMYDFNGYIDQSDEYSSSYGRLSNLDVPWAGYDIHHVIISEGVTSIGAYAFPGFSNMKRVDMPSTLRKIGAYAFYHNSGVQSDSSNAIANIVIPDAVEIIGEHAFDGCGNLHLGRFALPKSLRYLGDAAFSGVEAQETVILPSGLEYIGSKVFDRSNGHCSLVMTSTDCELKEDSISSLSGYSAGFEAYYGYTGSTLEMLAQDNGTPFAALNGDITDTIKYKIIPETKTIDISGRGELTNAMLDELMQTLSVRVPDTGSAIAPRSLFVNISIGDDITGSNLNLTNFKRVSAPESIFGKYSGNQDGFLYSYNRDKKLLTVNTDGTFKGICPDIATENGYTLSDMSDHIAIGDGVTNAKFDFSDFETIVLGKDFEKLDSGRIAPKPADKYSSASGILKEITFENPNCVIEMSPSTICNMVESKYLYNYATNDYDYENVYSYTGVIKGYKGSTAETYANEYGYKFVSLSSEAVTTTAPVSTSAKSTTTTTVTTSTARVYTKGTTTSTTTTAKTTTTKTTQPVVTTTETTTPSEVIHIALGDVNGDGIIDSSDATYILSEYANRSVEKEPTLTENQFMAADVNRDGAVNAIDSSIIGAYYAFMATGGTAALSDYIVSSSEDKVFGGDLYSENGGFTDAEIADSPVKPQLSISVDGNKGGKIYDLYDAAGKEVTVTLDLSGAEMNFASTGIHLYYDSRLSIVKCKKGEAVIDAFSTRYAVSENSGDMKSVFLASSGYEDYGLDGIMWTITFDVPEDAEYGDVFPFDIRYETGDLFTNTSADKNGALMQAYLFTQGICSPTNNKFVPSSYDIESVPALADINSSYDGYIAIAKPVVTTTVTSVVYTTTPTSTTSTAANTAATQTTKVYIPEVASDFVVTPKSVTAKAGDTVEVEVYAKAGSHKVAQYVVRLDETDLPQDITYTIDDKTCYAVDDNADHLFELIGDTYYCDTLASGDPTGVLEDEPVIIFTFTIPNTAKSGSYEWNISRFHVVEDGYNGIEFDATIMPGTITITDGSTVTSAQTASTIATTASTAETTTTAAGEKTASGVCGEDLIWSLDSNGTLTISGTGSMTVWKSYSNVPWFYHRASIKNVLLVGGVENIGRNAFYDCDNLSYISIPDSVKSIDAKAFSKCVSLTSMELPESVGNIEDGAFSECTSLESLTVYDPNCIFADSDSTVYSGAEIIGYSGSTAKTYANTYSRKFVSLGSSPVAVTTASNTTAASDTTTTATPFVTTSSTGESESSTTTTETVTTSAAEETTTTASTAATEETAATTTAIQPVDEDIACGKYVSWSFDDTGVLTISGTGDMYNWSVGEAPWNEDASRIKRIIIKDGVTSIGKYAFYNCTNLKSVTIPESVTNIGSGAFSGCGKLENVIIPEGVTEIGSYSFYNCGALTGVKLPDDIRSIGDYTFYGCSSLVSAELPNSLESIGNSAFSGCSSLSSVSLPDTLVTIGNNAFEDCASIATLTVPASVSKIGSGAFGGCTGLKYIIIKSRNCDIYDSMNTISDTASISGYSDSTAKKYADKYSRSFYSLAEEETTSTAPVTTASSTSSESSTTNTTPITTEEGTTTPAPVTTSSTAAEEVTTTPAPTTTSSTASEEVTTTPAPTTPEPVTTVTWTETVTSSSSEETTTTITVTYTETQPSETTTTGTTILLGEEILIKDAAEVSNDVVAINKLGVVKAVGIGDTTVKVADSDYVITVPEPQIELTIDGIKIDEHSEFSYHEGIKLEYTISNISPDFEYSAFISDPETGSLKDWDAVLNFKQAEKNVNIISFTLAASPDKFVDPSDANAKKIGYVQIADTLKGSLRLVEKNTNKPFEFSRPSVSIAKNGDQLDIAAEPSLNYSLGDINKDGLIDASDASEILSIYASRSTGKDVELVPEKFSAGDVNSDELIDANDASLILAYYAHASTGGTLSFSGFIKKNQEAQ